MQTTDLDAAVQAAVDAALTNVRGRVDELTHQVAELRDLIAFVLGDDDEAAGPLLAETVAHYGSAPDPAPHLINANREKQ